MATQLQFRRGNTAQTSTFTGVVAELTVDTSKNTIVVHDGSTPGGHPLAKEVFAQDAYNKANAAFIAANTDYDALANSLSSNVQFIAAINATQNTEIQAKVSKAGDTMTGTLNLLDAFATGNISITGNLSASQATFTNNVQANNVIVNTTLYAGIAPSLATPLPNLIAQFTGNTDSYVQINAENINPNGSSDFVATTDVGDDTTFYIDLGIQNSTRTDGALKPLDGYLYVQGNTGQVGGNLVIATASPGQKVRVLAGGLEDANTVVTFTDDLQSEFTGNVVPSTNNTQYLGSSSNRWHTLFVGPGSVDIDGVVLSKVSGKLQVSGATDIVLQGSAVPSSSQVSDKTNSAFTQANSSFDAANSASAYANGAFAQANAAFASANNVAPQVAPAFNTANAAFAHANAAYGQANTATTDAATADSKAVTAGNYANSAYNQANTATNDAAGASSYANGAFVQANAAFLQANTPSHVANSAAIYANGAFVQANAAYDSQNTTGSYANSAYIQANTAYTAAVNATNFVTSVNLYAIAAFTHANASYDTANAAFNQANTSSPVANSAAAYANGAFAQANAAFNKANTSVQTSGINSITSGSLAITNTGGIGLTVTGNVLFSNDLTVSGNIFLGGNATSFGANNITIEDSLIFLANNNNQDLVDIGFVAHFNPGAGQQHTGFVRDASDDTWKLFSNVYPNPTTTVDFTDAIYDPIRVGALTASSATVNGTNLLPYTQSAFGHANSAFDKANNALANTTGTFNGSLSVTGTLASLNSTGDEGGEITLSKSVSNTTLNTGVTIDVYQNKVRIFESGGTNRGLFIDMANTAAAGVGTNLLNPSSVTVNTDGNLTTTSFTTTASVAQVTVDSFATSTYRSAKYFAQMTAGSNYHVIELNVVHNGTTVWLAQYGEIFTNASLGTFDASIATGTLNLQFTPASATVTTIKVFRTAIAV